MSKFMEMIVALILLGHCGCGMDIKPVAAYKASSPYNDRNNLGDQPSYWGEGSSAEVMMISKDDGCDTAVCNGPSATPIVYNSDPIPDVETFLHRVFTYQLAINR